MGGRVAGPFDFPTGPVFGEGIRRARLIISGRTRRGHVECGFWGFFTP